MSHATSAKPLRASVKRWLRAVSRRMLNRSLAGPQAGRENALAPRQTCGIGPKRPISADMLASPIPISSRSHPRCPRRRAQAGDIAPSLTFAGRETAARLWYKDGNSPVTEADIAVDTFLKDRLSALLPEAGLAVGGNRRQPGPARKPALVWIVDPIDGTRAFAAGHPDWSVSIGARAGRPTRPRDRLRAGPRPALRGDPRRRRVLQRRAAPRLRRTTEPLRGSPGRSPWSSASSAAARSSTCRRCPPWPCASPGSRRARSTSASSRPNSARLGHRRRRPHPAARPGAVLTDLDGRARRLQPPEPNHGELVAAGAWLHPRVIEAMRA